MSSLDPKLSVVFDSIRDELARATDAVLQPRLEALSRELTEERRDIRQHAAEEQASSLAAAVADARATLSAQHASDQEHWQRERSGLVEARERAEVSAREASYQAASLLDQVRYLQARLAEVDLIWRKVMAERDALAESAGHDLLQLTRALARFDHCSTITQCLDALGEALAEVVPRAAVMLPRGEVWEVWRNQGPTSHEQEERPILTVNAPFSLERFGLSDVNDGPVGASLEGLMADDVPPDIVTPRPRELGRYFPLVMGDAVSVVVYADGGPPVSEDPQGARPSVAPDWPTSVARVVAHARLAIESATTSCLLRSAGVVLNDEVANAST